MLPADPDLAARCAGDGEFMLLARHWSGSVVIAAGERRGRLVLEDGVPLSWAPADGPTADGPGHVSLEAAQPTWDRLLARCPGPFANDLVPAQALGLAIGGDRETFWQYYPALRRLVDLLRAEGDDSGAPHPTSAVGDAGPAAVRFDSPVGRYVHLALEGRDHRVYFEEAGAGVPMLLQHTAGSHGVQWRHLFEDPWVTEHFRLIAYDLPFHGKSLPPSGEAWWSHPYRLTSAFAMSVPVALASALELDRPVFMGCSIGGCLALDLARWHPEVLRAVVAVEPALKLEATPDLLEGFWHPRVSNEYKAHMMHGLMSPSSPEAYRRETVFAYSQGWPPAFSGDLHYYLEDHDLREEAAGIDTASVAVHLLSGEYDYSATVGHGEAAHRAIPGSTFTAMTGLGHFPMSEDPARFMEYLRPVLASILDAP
ncbi:MAG TPA: alpha/beta hydrolase [Acidimicrobiales bacterium]|nr:alpha/beta hydrolase [Acidimicrobiales bacterium]